VKNMLMLRAEERVALLVKQPLVVINGDFDTATV
jgi:hypothetical protein